MIELGDGPSAIGSVIQAKILGSLELIDEGETDHKVIMIRSTDPHFSSVNNMDDLERYKPGITAKLDDWLISYKTSDGKPENTLTSTTPTRPEEAMAVVQQVAGFYRSLVNAGGGGLGYSLPVGQAQATTPQYRGSTGAQMPVDPNAPLGSGWRKLDGDENI